MQGNKTKSEKRKPFELLTSERLQKEFVSIIKFKVGQILQLLSPEERFVQG